MTIDAPFIRFPELATQRLQLRRIRQSDAPELFAILSDEEAMRFYGHEPHHNISETHSLISKIEVRYARREAIRWAVTLKGEDRLIGTCSLHHIDAESRRAETGYELHRAYWGRGLMPEAVAAILTYGFSEMELHRVEALIDIANEQSKNLLLKLGFTYEGNLRQRYFMNGRFEDEHYFGLLRDEWLARI